MNQLGKPKSNSSGKSQAVNPIIYSSDFTVALAADSELSVIALLGMSQSSLTGTHLGSYHDDM